MVAMGCDIHVYVEQARNGKWEYLPAPVDPAWNHLDNWFTDRNYELFGVLAGVRGSGQIAELRGLPLDASSCVLEEWKGWSTGAHSLTWYLLSELIGIDWQGVSENWAVFLKSLAQDDVPTALRLVMWFDS